MGEGRNLPEVIRRDSNITEITRSVLFYDMVFRVLLYYRQGKPLKLIFNDPTRDHQMIHFDLMDLQTLELEPQLFLVFISIIKNN